MMYRNRRGWGVYAAAALCLYFSGRAVPEVLAQSSVPLDRSALSNVEFRSPERVFVNAIRFAPGPEGVLFLLVDPREMNMGGGAQNREQIVSVDRVYAYIPGHREFGTPQALTGRQVRNTYEFRNLRVAVRHEGREVDMTLQGSVPLRHGRRTLVMPVTAQWTVRQPPSSSVFLVARDCNLTRTLQQSPFSLHDFTVAPVLQMRTMDGGRTVVASLTLGESGDGRGRQTYLFPMQGADSQIRVDAFNEQGHVIETLQLRNRRETFPERDSWTGQFRRLRPGQNYTLRATANLGPLGSISQSMEITIFEL